jgi:hypothetical protein
MGVASEKYKTSRISGILAFKDKSLIIPFDRKIYKSLLSLCSEYNNVIVAWNANGLIPLHKRKGVNLKASGFKFVDK